MKVRSISSKIIESSQNLVSSKIAFSDLLSCKYTKDLFLGKLLSLFSLQLKGMYSQAEQKEILTYVDSNCGNQWEQLTQLMTHSGEILGKEVENRA